VLRIAPPLLLNHFQQAAQGSNLQTYRRGVSLSERDGSGPNSPLFASVDRSREKTTTKFHLHHVAKCCNSRDIALLTVTTLVNILLDADWKVTSQRVSVRFSSTDMQKAAIVMLICLLDRKVGCWKLPGDICGRPKLRFDGP
jgi:hypothetical protein